MTILSAEADGMGWHYAFFGDDPRQINVRQLEDNSFHAIAGRWKAVVGGAHVGYFPTKDEAEAAAIAWLIANPE